MASIPQWLRRNVSKRRRQFRHNYFSDIGDFAQGVVHVLETAQQELLLQAIVSPVQRTDEGNIIEALSIPWLKIVEMLKIDPNFMFRLDPRKWEEMVAAAYEQAGFEEVTLTPRSGDHGRDVIAVKKGLSIRIVEQVKRYSPGHVVTADDVRALAGVVAFDPRASKGVLTTTSHFAPGIATDPLIAPAIPYRLELRDGPQLIQWLSEIARQRNSQQ